MRAPLAVRPPRPALVPILWTWPAGYAIVRAHPSTFGSTEFDRREDADARWSTIAPRGRAQGVLYGASTHEAAASETIFHTVPVDDGTGHDSRPRRVPLSPFESWTWSTLVCARDLNLVNLDQDGLTALGTSREELVLSGRLDYPVTRAWAEALWHAAPEADGLYWVPRQSPSDSALMLFEARDDRPGGVARGELFADGPPDPFFYPDGLERLFQLAARLNITVVI
jgi:hypothetical protein